MSASRRTFEVATIVALLAPGSPNALAASISGTVVDEGGAPVSGIYVRAWRPDTSKGFRIVATTSSADDGTYDLAGLDGGDYKVDVSTETGPGTWSDRWYDVQAPTSDGWAGEDADVLRLLGSDNVEGVDLTVSPTGDLNARIVSVGAPASDMLVRVEVIADPRVHHVGVARNDNDHVGHIYMRNLEPETYRVIVQHPSSTYETQVFPGPYGVGVGAADIGDLTFDTAMAADPYEPNESPAEAVAPSLANVDPSVFRQAPAQPFVSSGAWIGPGDVDWYCFEALASDRFLIYVETPFDVGGETRQNPWVDPIVSWWTADGSLIVTDDDSGLAPYGCLLDTGVITDSRRHCVAVGAYNDIAFDGTHQSTPLGRYQLRIELGNRSPTLEVFYNDGFATPIPPSMISIEELETVSFDVYGDDPDGDPLTYSFLHVDSRIGPVEDGVFDGDGPLPVTYDWTADDAGALSSPFTVTFRVSDGEFTAERTVWVAVSGENEVPSGPSIGGLFAGRCQDMRFIDDKPDHFAFGRAFDLEGVPLQLEVQIATADDPDAPIFELVVPQVADSTLPVSETDPPQLTYVWIDPELFDEDAHYLVRVRAYDGSGYSEWVECDFWINTSNQLPSSIEILSPPNEATFDYAELDADGGIDMVVSNALDPDGASDQVWIAYCVTTDASFAECGEDPARWQRAVQESGDDTTVDLVNLPTGETVYVVACAIDSHGECSSSDYVSFNVEAPILDGAGGGGGGGPPSSCACGGTSTAADGAWFFALVLAGLVRPVIRSRRRTRRRSR